MKKIKKYLVENGYTPLGLFHTLHILEVFIGAPIAFLVYLIMGHFYDDAFTIILAVSVVVVLIIIFTECLTYTLCRCPGCGRGLRIESMFQTHCMYCGEDLDGEFHWQSEVMAEQIREDAEKEELSKANISMGSLNANELNDSITGNANEGIGVIVRRATVKDIPFLLALLSQVLEVHASIKPDYFVSGYTKYNSTELEDILDDESKRVYVADINGAAVGYAFCDIKEMPAKPFVQHFKYMYIDDICIDSNFRGKGVATKIFEHVKEEARALGCRDITLNVWTGNQRAFAFYQKMGMKPQKTTMEIKV